MNFGVRIKRETRLKRWRIEEGGGGGGNGGDGDPKKEIFFQIFFLFLFWLFFGSFCLVFSSFHLLLPLVGSLVSLYCSFVFLLGEIPDSLWGSMSLFFLLLRMRQNTLKNTRFLVLDGVCSVNGSLHYPVRKMRCTPESVSTGPLISPILRANLERKKRRENNN